jgi:hypothetical protein
MTGFLGLLEKNRNYRFTWTGQIVSEVGDHFNNVAVFALALAIRARVWWSREFCSLAASAPFSPDPSRACCWTAWIESAS